MVHSLPPPSLNTPSPSTFPGPVASLLPDPWECQVASLSAQGLQAHRGRCQRPGRQGTGSVTCSESGRVRSFSGRQGAKGEKAGYSPQRRPPGTGQLTKRFRFSSFAAVLATLALSQKGWNFTGQEEPRLWKWAGQGAMGRLSGGFLLPTLRSQAEQSQAEACVWQPSRGECGWDHWFRGEL